MYPKVSTCSILDNNKSKAIVKKTTIPELGLKPYHFRKLISSLPKNLPPTALKIIYDIYEFNFNKCEFFKMDRTMALEFGVGRECVNRALSHLERQKLITRYWATHNNKERRYIKIHDNCIETLLSLSKPYNAHVEHHGRLIKADSVPNQIVIKTCPDREETVDNPCVSRSPEARGVISRSHIRENLNSKKEDLSYNNNISLNAVDKFGWGRSDRSRESFFNNQPREETTMRQKSFAELYKPSAPRPTTNTVVPPPKNFVRASEEVQAECMRKIREALYGPRKPLEIKTDGQGDVISTQPIPSGGSTPKAPQNSFN